MNNKIEPDDPLYNESVELIKKTGRANISLVQRHLRVEFNRAARLVELMEERGIVSPPDSRGVRKILGPSPL